MNYFRNKLLETVGDNLIYFSQYFPLFSFNKPCDYNFQIQFRRFGHFFICNIQWIVGIICPFRLLLEKYLACFYTNYYLFFLLRFLPHPIHQPGSWLQLKIKLEYKRRSNLIKVLRIRWRVQCLISISDMDQRKWSSSIRESQSPRWRHHHLPLLVPPIQKQRSPLCLIYFLGPTTQCIAKIK